MNSKELRNFLEAYRAVYAPQELTEEQVWEEVENWVNSLIEEGYDLSDYTWEEMYKEYLEEAPARKNYGDPTIDLYNKSIEASKRRQEQVEREKAQQAATRASTQRRDMGVVLRDGKYKTIYTKTPEALALQNRLNKEEGRDKLKPTEKPPVPGTQPAGSGSTPQSRPTAGSGSTPPPRPAAASGPVLSKKDGVEGTGVGANFKARAFTAAEKSRYASVAAKNAARTSASSGAATPAAAQPKPATPAVGKLGNTSFERRTPTSAELRAAQGARDKGASPEKALQAAQKTNLPTTGPSPATPDLGSVSRDLARANTVANLNRAPAGSAAAKALAAKPATSAPTPTQIASASQGIKSINNKKSINPVTQSNSYEWPSAKTIRDIADAYSSIYEAKKVDQDQDGDNDFADVRIARMIASGMSRAEAIAAVKNKEYNEEVEIDEATRMRKELGKEGETETRQELAKRSNAYQRSGSVDKTIAGAEAAAGRTTFRKRDESEGDYKTRMQKRSQTLNKLAANRRGSVRDKPRAGLRGYAAKVEGDDKDLQSARGSARSAGTLTPREKKQLNMEAYETYEFVASYLLENNFAETLNDANVIIENMSDNWFTQIMEDIRGASYTPNPIGNAIRAGAGLLKNTMNRPSVQGAIKTGSQMLQKSVPSGGYSTREGDGKPRETPLWDGPSKPTPTTPTKPQTKKQPPMRDEPLF